MLPHAHVLLADDDTDLLDAVSAGLTHLGADVVRASSGAELIDCLANAGPFDLVITDVGMPWMSGLQAMYATRSAGLGTPVIVMTALHDRRIPALVQALGANAVLLRKPFDLSDLESAALKLLSSERPEAATAPPPSP